MILWKEVGGVATAPETEQVVPAKHSDPEKLP